MEKISLSLETFFVWISSANARKNKQKSLTYKPSCLISRPDKRGPCKICCVHAPFSSPLQGSTNILDDPLLLVSPSCPTDNPEEHEGQRPGPSPSQDSQRNGHFIFPLVSNQDSVHPQLDSISAHIQLSVNPIV